jgi:hypothetical protein
MCDSERCMWEHIPIDRAWILIQEASAFSPTEVEHLEKCDQCREFLQSFVSVAPYVGFSVDLRIQYSVVNRERAA